MKKSLIALAVGNALCTQGSYVELKGAPWKPKPWEGSREDWKSSGKRKKPKQK